MRDEYDLTNAVRHPLAGQFNGRYTVIVHYDLNKDTSENDEMPIETPLVVAEQDIAYQK